jgi:hypothetical protein
LVAVAVEEVLLEAVAVLAVTVALWLVSLLAAVRRLKPN